MIISIIFQIRILFEYSSTKLLFLIISTSGTWIRLLHLNITKYSHNISILSYCILIVYKSIFFKLSYWPSLWSNIRIVHLFLWFSKIMNLFLFNGCILLLPRRMTLGEFLCQLPIDHRLFQSHHLQSLIPFINWIIIRILLECLFFFFNILFQLVYIWIIYIYNLFLSFLFIITFFICYYLWSLPITCCIVMICEFIYSLLGFV